MTAKQLELSLRFATQDTEDLFLELIENSWMFESLREEKMAYGKFSDNSLRHFVHEEFYDELTTSLLNIDWDLLATEINRKL